jgi:hypothetical protein
MAMFQLFMTIAILKHAVDRGNDTQMPVNTGIDNVYLLPLVNIYRTLGMLGERHY